MAKTDGEFRPGNLDANGHNRIARDFDRALGLARLSGVASVLMQQARELSWAAALFRAKKGAPRPEPHLFRFNLSAVARLLGCDRKSVREALGWLVEAGLLAEAEGDLFRINKDYRTWVRPGAGDPLLTELQVVFAMKGIDLSSGESVPPESGVAPGVSTPHETDEPWGVHTPPPGVSTPHPPGVSTPHPPGVSTPHPPARALEERASERVQRESERDREIVVVTREDAPSIPSTLGEVREWAKLAVPEFEDIGGKLPGWCASYPIPWVHDAISSAIANAKPGGVAAYANKCLIRWKDRGGPPLPVSAPPSSAPSPPPRRRSVAQRYSAENLARAAKTREIFARRKVDASD